ncbi:MAG: endonuclease/exonuclease/phosphatase family protein [Planctomycetota bacterium]
MKDPIRVTSATRIWKSFRRLITRNEWIVWLLGLKRSESKPVEPGLILIQIDGLSQSQLKHAIREGRMPFLKSLIDKESYINHSLYSGLPSSTPAVQAELFYGVRTAVPAFGFRDHRNGTLVRMFANQIASEVESNISQINTGLLTNGSSYANIYSGGAKEVHFCATSFGWNEFLNTVNPLKIFLVLLLNFFMFVRVAGLILVEAILATLEFIRGVISGKEFWQELMMIPARVVVVVLLRELVTVGASYDAARGLPIIHLNLLGYDEQAHRRGPKSKFAHWTLQGIDSAIRKIWNAAHQGAGREYDFWIFSDHGQETTIPYQHQHGKLIQEVVASVVEKLHKNELKTTIEKVKSKFERVPSRANWLGISWMVSVLFGEQDHDIQTRSPWVQTVTSGPVGFVYLLSDVSIANREQIAVQLVNEHHVPICAIQDDSGNVLVFKKGKQLELPSEADQVFPGHPFIDDLLDDFMRMVRHIDSGNILIIGWDGEQPASSFVLQNGAHAGPGHEETHAFALLPSDTLLPVRKHNYLRPDDLRLAALRFLGRDEHGELVRRNRQRTTPIRVLTYNVHACVGMDGQLSPERIARVVDQSEADIICLQELDVSRQRSEHRDQAQVIAQWLEMSHQFHPAWHFQEEQFGNAVLTRMPMRVIKQEGLHHHKDDRSRRSALWVEVNIGDQVSLQIINTHLSIYPQEQKIQAQQLITEWIEPASLLGPVILCGDFNASTHSKTYKILSKALRDIESFDDRPTRRTLFSPFPIARVDHGFISSELVCSKVRVVDSRLAKVASDHLPLWFDIEPPSINSFKSQPSKAEIPLSHDSSGTRTV